jgi:hypothetical protein
MRVFLVFVGDYEESSCYGVFSSRDKAESFLADLRSRVVKGQMEAENKPWRVAKWESSIEEFTLDSGVVPEEWCESPAAR